jgi:hypothetical protein
MSGNGNKSYAATPVVVSLTQNEAGSMRVKRGTSYEVRLTPTLDLSFVFFASGGSSADVNDMPLTWTQPFEFVADTDTVWFMSPAALPVNVFVRVEAKAALDDA